MRFKIISATLATMLLFSPAFAAKVDDNSRDPISKAAKAKPKDIEKKIVIRDDVSGNFLEISTKDVSFKPKRSAFALISPLGLLALRGQMDSDKAFLVARINKVTGDVIYSANWTETDRFSGSNYSSFGFGQDVTASGPVALHIEQAVNHPSQWVTSKNGPFTTQTLMPSYYTYEKTYRLELSRDKLVLDMKAQPGSEDNTLSLYLSNTDNSERGLGFRIYAPEATAFLERAELERTKIAAALPMPGAVGGTPTTLINSVTPISE